MPVGFGGTRGSHQAQMAARKRKLAQDGIVLSQTFEKLLNALGVQRGGEEYDGRRGRAIKKGQRLGLGLGRTWALLFESNERVSKGKKMTDREIKRQMLLEFPELGVMTSLGPVGRVGKYTVNEQRAIFLRGRYTCGKKPELFSYRYNENGDRVDGRTGKFIMTQEEQDAAREKWSRELTDEQKRKQRLLDEMEVGSPLKMKSKPKTPRKAKGVKK